MTSFLKKSQMSSVIDAPIRPRNSRGGRRNHDKKYFDSIDWALNQNQPQNENSKQLIPITTIIIEEAQMSSSGPSLLSDWKISPETKQK